LVIQPNNAIHPEVVTGVPDGLTCQLLHNAFTPEECRALIARLESQGFDDAAGRYPAWYRNNDRLVMDDPVLAAGLFHRLRPHLPEHWVEADGSRWVLSALNTRMRCCRYRAGQFFGVHQDGHFHRSAQEESRLTFMVYLNGAQEFSGGGTRFYRARTDGAPAFTVTPRAGTLIVFDHGLWHDGEPVPQGTKYVFRSDILYRRLGPATPQAGAHLGYVWRVRARRDGGLITASRDKSIAGWSASLVRDAEYLGHEASALDVVEDDCGRWWSVSRDGTARCWQGGRAVVSVPVSRDALICVTSVGDGQVAVGDARGSMTIVGDAGVVRRWRAHDAWVWAVAFDGALHTASDDGVVKRWSVLGALESQWRVNLPVRALAVCNGLMVAGDAEGNVRTPTSCFKAHDGGVTDLAFVDDGRVVTASEDGWARVWNLNSAELLGAHRHQNFVRSVAVLRDGRIASASYDGTVALWSVPGVQNGQNGIWNCPMEMGGVV